MDFKHLTSDVITYHQETYAGQLQYSSANMIVLQGNLGVRNDLSPSILKHLDADIKEFRAKYKPYDYEYAIERGTDCVCVQTLQLQSNFTQQD